jgi:hypothetical protein
MSLFTPYDHLNSGKAYIVEKDNLRMYVRTHVQFPSVYVCMLTQDTYVVLSDE